MSDEYQSIDDTWPPDFIPTGTPYSTTPVVILDQTRYDEMVAAIASLTQEAERLKAQLAESYPKEQINAMIDNNRVSDAVTIASLNHELAELRQRVEARRTCDDAAVTVPSEAITLMQMLLQLERQRVAEGRWMFKGDDGAYLISLKRIEDALAWLEAQRGAASDGTATANR